MAFSVGEASRRLGIPASTLRYYESEGLLSTLERTPGGRRLFTDVELSACRVIECLKASGLSIKEIKSFMDMVKQGDESLDERLALFKGRREALKAEIERLEDVLAVLDFKCWYYETASAAGTEDAVRDLPESEIPARHRAARARIDRGSDA